MPILKSSILGHRILHSRSGTVSVEYGLVAALIAISALLTMQTLGQQVRASWNSTDTQVSTAALVKP